MLRTFRRVCLDDMPGADRPAIRKEPDDDMSIAQCYDSLARLSTGPSISSGRQDSNRSLKLSNSKPVKPMQKSNSRRTLGLNTSRHGSDRSVGSRREIFAQGRSQSVRQQSNASINTTGSGKSRTSRGSRRNLTRSVSDDGMVRVAGAVSRSSSRRNLSSTSSLDIEALSQKSLGAGNLNTHRRASLLERKGSQSTLNVSNHSLSGQPPPEGRMMRRPSLAPEIAASLDPAWKRKRTPAQQLRRHESFKTPTSTPSLLPPSRDRAYESDTGVIGKNKFDDSNASFFSEDPFSDLDASTEAKSKDSDSLFGFNPFAGNNPFSNTGSIMKKPKDAVRSLKFAAIASSFVNKVKAKTNAKSSSKKSEPAQTTCSENSDDDFNSDDERRINAAAAKWGVGNAQPSASKVSSAVAAFKEAANKSRSRRHSGAESSDDSRGRSESRNRGDRSVVSSRDRRHKRRSDDESVVSSRFGRHRSRRRDDESVVSSRSRRHRSRRSDDKSVVSRRSRRDGGYDEDRPRRTRNRDDRSVNSRRSRRRDDASVSSRRRGRRDNDGRSNRQPSRSRSSRSVTHRRRRDDEDFDDEESCFEWESMEQDEDDKCYSSGDDKSHTGYRSRSQSAQPRPRRLTTKY